MCSIFFFSSRRRHTRSLCDWSSDVCSSDLANDAGRVRQASVGFTGCQHPRTIAEACEHSTTSTQAAGVGRALGAPPMKLPFHQRLGQLTGTGLTVLVLAGCASTAIDQNFSSARQLAQEQLGGELKWLT